MWRRRYYNKLSDEPLDIKPISFKGWKGQLKKLKTVPGRQERLRDFVDELINDMNKQ